MYRYVTDKNFLKKAYSKSADIVNRFKQALQNAGVECEILVVGSMGRNMVTQNGNQPIDFDFNLLIPSIYKYDAQKLREFAQSVLDDILLSMGEKNCSDSTSVLSTRLMRVDGFRTQFKVDICIVARDQFSQLNRLIHDKSGVAWGRVYWNINRDFSNLDRKEKYLKPKYWNEVRETYIEKKNLYLRQNDHDHPSFVCYIEAVSEVYNKHFNGFLL